MSRIDIAKQRLREQAEHHLRVAAMEELRSRHPGGMKPAYKERGALFWRLVFVPLDPPRAVDGQAARDARAADDRGELRLDTAGAPAGRTVATAAGDWRLTAFVPNLLACANGRKLPVGPQVTSPSVRFVRVGPVVPGVHHGRGEAAETTAPALTLAGQARAGGRPARQSDRVPRRYSWQHHRPPLRKHIRTAAPRWPSTY